MLQHDKEGIYKATFWKHQKSNFSKTGTKKVKFSIVTSFLLFLHRVTLFMSRMGNKATFGASGIKLCMQLVNLLVPHFWNTSFERTDHS